MLQGSFNKVRFRSGFKAGLGQSPPPSLGQIQYYKVDCDQLLSQA